MEDSETTARDRSVDSEEVDRLRRAVEEERDRSLRLRAEFENFRRRTTREQEAAGREGRRAALLPLLAVLDTLERALGAGSSDRQFYDGVAATHRLFADALRQAGADAIDTVGQPFDPTVHEAVATVASDGGEPGTVAKEVRRGWRLGNDLLRPAQVVVATSSESDDSWR